MSVSLVIAVLAAGSVALGCVAEIETGGDGKAPSESSRDTSEDECKEGESRVCDSDFSPAPGLPTVPGVQQCVLDEDDNLTWGGCVVNTPLVLSFDRTPVEFTASADSFGFDLTGTMSVATDWPTAKTPWLALDRDGNGRIDNGGELFGSATVLSNGKRPSNGFIALRELDDNGDGQITPADAAFPRLLLWSDRDDDRASTAGELASASSRKLLSIDLGYTTSAPRCNARGNCEIERATFRYMDDTGAARTGEVIDVHLKSQ
jgi:hypothetical protein